MLKNKKLLRIVALAIALLGGFLLVWILSPIIFYEITAPSRFDNFLSPIPRNTESLLAKNSLDYTKASNWFPTAAQKEDFLSESAVKFYTLSIPKLGIEQATVAIGGEDLTDSLIQYPGTALPGKKGNAVIFGHSILPQFYDPKNYLAIFSKLPTLEKGDEIKVNFDGLTYLFIVENLFEVLPSDIQVLEQNASDAFITLVTCTPPGHPLKPKRLIVRARVAPLPAKFRP